MLNYLTTDNTAGNYPTTDWRWHQFTDLPQPYVAPQYNWLWGPCYVCTKCNRSIYSTEGVKFTPNGIICSQCADRYCDCGKTCSKCGKEISSHAPLS